MSEHAESVKAARDLLARFAKRAEESSNLQRAKEIEELVTGLDKAREELIHLSRLTTALPHDLSDIHDLPPDLLDELSVTKVDDLDNQIVTVLNALGGTADLDRVLIGLYRRFGVKQKRRFLQNKMYRMREAGVIWTVPGRKGLYSTQPQDEADADDDDPNADLLGKPTEAPKDDSDDIPF